MEINLSLVISIILASSAFISPIATALINNSHQRKMYKLQLKQEEQVKKFHYERGIYEDLIHAALAYHESPSKESASDFAKSYANAVLYFPEQLRGDLDILSKQLNSQDHSLPLIQSLSTKIRNHLDATMRK